MHERSLLLVPENDDKTTSYLVSYEWTTKELAAHAGRKHASNRFISEIKFICIFINMEDISALKLHLPKEDFNMSLWKIWHIWGGARQITIKRFMNVDEYPKCDKRTKTSVWLPHVETLTIMGWRERRRSVNKCARRVADILRTRRCWGGCEYTLSAWCSVWTC